MRESAQLRPVRYNFFIHNRSAAHQKFFFNPFRSCAPLNSSASFTFRTLPSSWTHGTVLGSSCLLSRTVPASFLNLLVRSAPASSLFKPSIIQQQLVVPIASALSFFYIFVNKIFFFLL